MNDYDSEDVVLVIAGVFAAFCVGRFLLMFLLVMGNIYYRDFTDKEILQFEEYLNRIRVNLEEWSDK